LVAETLGLEPRRWTLSFQSRVGTKEWLRPYTDETLKAWGAEGVGSVQVVSPGFSADCLETIEEIGVENRDYFQTAGGGDYGFIPCLNDRRDHLEMLAGLIRRHIAGWPEAEGAGGDAAAELAARADRARALGAPA
jgi:ferrochelatase